MVTALMVKPGEKPCVVPLVDDGEFLNAMVSIGATLMCSAAVLPVEKDVVAIYAYEGVISGLKGNRKVGKRIIAGTFYIVKITDGKLKSLTADEILKYSNRFRKAQEYSDTEVMDSWFEDFWVEP